MAKSKTYYKLVRKIAGKASKRNTYISAVVNNPKIRATYHVGQITSAPKEGLGLFIFEDLHTLGRFFEVCVDVCGCNWRILGVQPLTRVYKPKWALTYIPPQGPFRAKQNLFRKLAEFRFHNREHNVYPFDFNLTPPPKGTVLCRRLLVVADLGIPGEVL